MPTGIYKRTEEMKRNISEAHKGYNPSQKTRELLSKISKNFWKNPKNKKIIIERDKKIGLANSISLKGKHHSEKTKKKMSLAHKGYNPSQKTRELLSKIHLGKKLSEEHRKKLSMITKKRLLNSKNHPFYNKHHTKKAKRKISIQLKKLWKNESFAKKMFKAFQLKPTLPEIQIQQIIKLNNLPFNYTGNGKIWINGFNPDFLSKNPKQIIEVNGECWHRNKNREIRKKRAYNSLGYKLLIIWSKELENPQRVTEKIINFIQK